MNGRERVRALVAAAARVADGASELGRRARARLAASTGLAPANVAWALEEALETAPSEAELDGLMCSAMAASRGGSEAARAVHVILPANVFVAAHRAIALGLAASARVCVRPSRREPVFASLLAEAAPGLFEIVSEVAPEPGDHVWAYGGDRSLEAVRAALPPGTVLHAQGPGYALAVVDASAAGEEAAGALARDVAAFDQRGCLSPRAAVVLGAREDARRFAGFFAGAMATRAREVPRGRLDAAEAAEIRRFLDAATYAGELLPAGPGAVCVTHGVKLALAPVGRHVTVSAAPDLAAALRDVDAALVTAVGVAGPSELAREVAAALPGARVSPLGRMQCPAFDGPADRRPLSAATDYRR